MGYGRKQLEILRTQLDNERSSFTPFHRDLATYILPTRQRFLISDANRGDRRNQKIIDSTGTMAANTLSAGMMSGVTSPARPWFRLGAPDPSLNESGPVKSWLHTVTDRMAHVFVKSNLYNVLPQCYRDLGVFGTAPISIEEDLQDIIRFQSFPVGSYYIAKDYKGKVNVFMREYRMTIRQMVEQFGNRDANGNIDWSNFSTYIKYQYDLGALETWVDIVHAVMPNEKYKIGSPFSKEKRFKSCYYERGASTGQMTNYMQGADDDKYLSESGFDYFPFLVPRWSLTGEDVYATDCPGMTAIGDIKQLQAGEKKTAKAVDKMIDPPMIAPTSMQNSKSSILPGDITFADTREGQQGFRPVYQVDPRINEMELKQNQIRDRVQRAFYADLFLMLANSDRRQITAREIDERHEEKLLALGPVLEQLNQDLLDPLIDITFQIMLKRGLIPDPPPELQGQELKVEYISVMAQAQKMVGISGLERFVGYVGQVAQFKPDVLDKFDADQSVDVYGDMMSIVPGIVRTDKDVENIRAIRAQGEAARQRQEAVATAAQSAKTLADASMEGDTALNRIISGVTGA